MELEAGLCTAVNGNSKLNKWNEWLGTSGDSTNKVCKKISVFLYLFGFGSKVWWVSSSSRLLNEQKTVSAFSSTKNAFTTRKVYLQNK